MDSQSSLLVTALDLASTPSMKRGPSTSTAVNPPVMQLKPESIVLPRELVLEVQKADNLLIIDCRSAATFRESKINVAACVNAPFQASYDAIRIESKTDALQTMMKCFPELLPHLYLPGHYSRVVIMDDKSVLPEYPKQIQTMLEALKKWNESTRTSISVLEGGFVRFSQEFPNMIVTATEARPAYPIGTPSLADFLNDSEEDYTDQELEVVGEFLRYLQNLDEMVSVLRNLIILRAKLMALKSLEPSLYAALDGEENKLTRFVEKNIPDACKCPVCCEVYTEKIIQCTNGHSICSGCHELLRTCPECRIPYVVDVRNRALESMIANFLTAKCVCGTILKPSEIKSHILTCVKKTKPGMEITKVENELVATRYEIVKMTDCMGKIHKNLLEAETRWFSRLAMDLGLPPMTWDTLCNYWHHKKLTIVSLQATLFS